jgi:hypothetical protein
MPKIKTFLLLTLVLVFSISLFGCGLFLPDTAAPEELTGQDGELPEWLLAAHREVEIEGTEISDDLPEEDDLAIGGTDEDDGVNAPSAVQETPAQPEATNTSTPAPAPAPAPSTSTEVPKWKQAGTKEFLMKMNLDELVARYKRLSARTEPTDEDKAEIAYLKPGIIGIADELGINLKSEYGLTFSSSSSASDGGFFHDWDNADSPTGDVFSKD